MKTLKLLTISLISSFFMQNTYADIKNECEVLNPNKDPILAEFFSNYSTIPLFSNSENRIDLEAKKNNDKFKAKKIKKSQVVEAERLFFVKNKNLLLDKSTYANKKVIGVVIYSDFKSKRALGITLKNFKIVDTEKVPLRKITPGREVLHNPTIIDLLATPTQAIDYYTNEFTSIDNLLTVKPPFSVELNIRKNPEIKSQWNRFIFALDEELNLYDNFLLKGNFSMDYKLPKNKIKKYARKASNLISGTRIDNCIYLILE